MLDARCWPRDAQPLHQVEHESRRVACQGIHAAAEIGAVAPLDLVRIQFQSGIDLPAVASGSAPTHGMRLQQSDLPAGFGEMQGRRQSGDPAAHDDHIGTAVAAQRRTRRGRLSGFMV